MELQVQRPLSVRPGHSSCGLLALDLPAQGSNAHRHPSAGSLAVFRTAAVSLVGYTFVHTALCQKTHVGLKRHLTVK